MKRFVPLFCVLFLWFGCRNKISTREGLLEYIGKPENGLSKEFKATNEIEAVLSYLPDQLSVKRKYDGQGKLFMLLRLSRKGAQVTRQLDNESYGELIQLLSFRMLNYIVVHDEKSNGLQVVDALYQPTFGLNNFDEIIIAIDKSQVSKSETIHITFNEFGLKTGPLTFSFQTKNLSEVDEMISENLNI